MKIRKVLVVDNNVTIVELLSAHLAAEGYEVAKAFDGLQALDRLAETGELPDVIILDLIMPRLDGQRLTRFLKQDELYAAIPVVILTGIATEDEGRILDFGADAFIAKGRIEDTVGHIRDTFRWLESRGAPGEPQRRVLGVEKLYPREMTRELLTMKHHFETMLGMMREGVVELDQDHRVLYANPAACRLLGTEDHRLFGRSLPGLFVDRDQLLAYLESLPCSGGAAPAPLCIAHGARMLRLGFSTLAEHRTPCGAIVILEDVTSQVRRERSLLELTDAIVLHAPVGLCLLDAAGTVLAANPAFARVFRLPADRALTGSALAAGLAGTGIAPESLLPPSLEAGASPEPRTVEFTTQVFPERIVVHATATAVDTAEGRRVLLLAEDVTEMAAMERDLRRANEELAKANRAKSTFLSMVSHELRTPLAVVRGYLSLILEGKIGPEPERILEALRVADKRARHLQHLIEELLDLSRIESGRLALVTEPIAMRKHALEVADMFREDCERRKVAVSVEIPEDLPPALADHDKVHQIFTNFLSNAVKFTPEGGRITVTGRAAGPGLELSVADTGIGIPADKIARVFDKFYQVDSSEKPLYPGTGLGLAIVKMIVSALGGTVRVESAVGVGTTFTFTLPRAGAPAAVAPAAPAAVATPPAPPPAARTRVLVVDDDADTLSMIRLLLPPARFEIVEAHDAFAGLREYYFRRPDIVLVDALLPLMSGLELCRVVKQQQGQPPIPVIILSAAAQEDEIRSGYQVGADAYLVKPFVSQDLFEKILRLTAPGGRS